MARTLNRTLAAIRTFLVRSSCRTFACPGGPPTGPPVQGPAYQAPSLPRASLEARAEALRRRPHSAGAGLPGLACLARLGLGLAFSEDLAWFRFDFGLILVRLGFGLTLVRLDLDLV